MAGAGQLSAVNIILTGASKGLGRGIAAGMWKQGANLLLVARSMDALTELRRELHAGRVTEAQQAHVCVEDLANPDAPARIVDAARRAWTRLDVLVNNAAILGPAGKAWETDAKAWRETIRVNLQAPVDLCRLCVPWMLHGGGGRIINLSGGGAASPRPNFSAYATAKAGLVRFTEVLAEEAKSSNVQANCVAPGIMNTDMVKAVVAVGPQRAGRGEYDQALKQQREVTSNQDRAVELCVLLASSAAQGITGKLISAVWDPWESLAARSPDLAESDIYTLRRIVPKDRGKTWGDR